MPTSHRNHRGFTLVELLVVIAIIGVLVALLLPAVQSARESARRAQCINNLKQIGLAVHNYNDVLQVLPPGAFWFGASTENRGSILVHLLPYIEQQNVYDVFDFKGNSPVIDDQTLPSGKLIVTARIPPYHCPSDADTVRSDGVQCHSYAANSGAGKRTNSPSCQCTDATVHDVWNAYALSANYDYPTGPFSRYPPYQRLRLNDVKDGLSNTIFFGETRMKCSLHNQQGWTRSNNGNGLVGTVIPINAKTCDNSSTDACKRPCNWYTELGFKSLHPGGCNFGMGDGSVQFVRQNLDHKMYQYLGSINDGVAVPIQ